MYNMTNVEDELVSGVEMCLFFRKKTSEIVCLTFLKAKSKLTINIYPLLI